MAWNFFAQKCWESLFFPIFFLEHGVSKQGERFAGVFCLATFLFLHFYKLIWVVAWTINMNFKKYKLTAWGVCFMYCKLKIEKQKAQLSIWRVNCVEEKRYCFTCIKSLILELFEFMQGEGKNISSLDSFKHKVDHHYTGHLLISYSLHGFWSLTSVFISIIFFDPQKNPTMCVE